ncbi:hypothetical protein [Treponema zioleckii]|uniref:hypothetical protein n=1 Tax=Treponema zioleckii TaxID=331680 RepID=UPI00168B9C4C|nr:hypothetical protein [Treponema zioleckii]
MKKVLRNIVCGLAAVNLVALAVSCSDGLDDDDPFVKGGVITNPNTGETGENGNSSGDANATVIFSTETVLDWDMSNTVKIEASKFADATDTSKIVITYVADDNTDYHTFKLMGGEGNENELYAGTAEGFSINTTATNSDDLHGCQFTTAPSTTATNLSYTPTDAEWTKIKTNGFAIIGHGAKVTKVALASSATTNNSAAEPGYGGGY